MRNTMRMEDELAEISNSSTQRVVERLDDNELVDATDKAMGLALLVGAWLGWAVRGLLHRLRKK